MSKYLSTGFCLMALETLYLLGLLQNAALFASVVTNLKAIYVCSFYLPQHAKFKKTMRYFLFVIQIDHNSKIIAEHTIGIM